MTDSDARELLVEVAHDLRSPLSAIMMMADAMRRGQSGPVTPDQDRQLGIICRAALSLCTTAADVVEFARGEKAPARRPGVPFRLHAALENVRDAVTPMLADRDIELRIILPASDSHRIGLVSAFTRAILNLVTNAAKHTDRGIIEVSIAELQGDGDTLECSVSDTGCGMTPAVLRAVFAGAPDLDPAESLTSAGVGLAICRRLVEAMNSTLHAESVVGLGTRFHFTVTLPRTAAVA